MIKYLSVGPSWKDWENGYRTLITQSFKAQQKKNRKVKVLYLVVYMMYLNVVKNKQMGDNDKPLY